MSLPVAPVLPGSPGSLPGRKQIAQLLEFGRGARRWAETASGAGAAPDERRKSSCLEETTPGVGVG